MAAWNACPSRSLPPNGIPANSSISRWPGFKPPQEAERSEPFAIRAGICCVGAGSGVWRIGDVMAVGVGSRRTHFIEDYRADVFRVRACDRRAFLETRRYRIHSRRSDV